MGMLKPIDLEFFRELYQHFKAHGDSSSFGEETEHYEVQGWSREKVHHHHSPKEEPSLRRCDTSIAASDAVVKPRPKPQPVEVKVVGVWDTVGSLGLPESLFTKITSWNKGFQFHDTALNPSKWSTISI